MFMRMTETTSCFHVFVNRRRSLPQRQSHPRTLHSPTPDKDDNCQSDDRYMSTKDLFGLSSARSHTVNWRSTIVVGKQHPAKSPANVNLSRSQRKLRFFCVPRLGLRHQE